MLDNYLLLLDIDWTMYTRKLPDGIVDKILNADIDDIKEGEFDVDNLRAPGLDDLLTKVGKERLGVVSNGIKDHQHKKLKGLGVLDYFNPLLIIVSHEIAKLDMGNSGEAWNDEIAKKIMSADDCSQFNGVPEYGYICKWDKPSISMVELAHLRFMYEHQKTEKDYKLPHQNIFYLGDREWDMIAVTDYGGNGLHVRTENHDTLHQIDEDAMKRIVQVNYCDFPQIPAIIENWQFAASSP